VQASLIAQLILLPSGQKYLCFLLTLALNRDRSACADLAMLTTGVTPLSGLQHFF
jgi:hypothetical protein